MLFLSCLALCACFITGKDTTMSNTPIILKLKHYLFFILLFIWSWECISFGALATPTRQLINNNNNNGGGSASPTRLEMFVDALPSPSVLKGYSTDGEGRISPGFLTIGMFQTKVKFHRDLPLTKVFAYGTSAKTASIPGPIIEAIAGVDTYVRWENHLPSHHIFAVDRTLTPNISSGVPTVVHLHGGLNEPASDGNAMAWFTSGFAKRGPAWTQKVFHYRNPGDLVTILYHDHAMGYTRLNVLAGLLGGYVIRNSSRDDNLFHLSSAPFHDLLLVISDKNFLKDGSIYLNATGVNPTINPSWQPEYFGDVMTVNGKAWPFLKVNRGKYRFRIFNACNSRFLNLAMGNGLPFTQIGSDSYFLQSPVVLKEILLAPAEGADVIVDFSNAPSRSEIILTNSAPYPFPNGNSTNSLNGVIMKFIVSSKKEGKGIIIPSKIVPVIQLRDKKVAKTRYITMSEEWSSTGQPMRMLLNFLPYEAPVTEFPRLGTTEAWYIINVTPDNHPLHTHLTGFQVVGEQQLSDPTRNLTSCLASLKDPKACNVWSYTIGKPSSPPPSEMGWKNIYKVKPYAITKLLIHFSQTNMQPFPFDATVDPGYLYHCHIIDHEDNMMMRPFKLIA